MTDDTSRSLDARNGAREGCVCASASTSFSATQSCDDDKDFAARLEAAKLASLAEFAAGAGHEINNPLATISGRVQMLLRGEKNPQRRQELMTIGGQALRIRDMIGDLMLFARPPLPRPERLNLSEVVRAAIDPLYNEAAQHVGEIRLEQMELVEVMADAVQLKIVAGSLVRNSLEAQLNGGAVIVSVTESSLGDRAAGLLTITDFGPGLSEIERAHLFDPFFSGRQAGRGLGFGLPKCWRIVTGHYGRIEVDSGPEAGTTFRVYWPGVASQD